MEYFERPGAGRCYREIGPEKSELVVSEYGGHAISWKIGDGKERLYLSPKANFSPSTAIRGGIPIIFPQFSDHGPFGRHGFARKSPWEFDPETKGFQLRASPETLADWPHEFLLSLSFSLSPAALDINLTVENPSSDSFSFQAALHTYLAVEDATTCSITGLESLNYQNEVTRKTERGENAPLVFGKEIDRAYFGAAKHPVMVTSETSDSVEVQSIGFSDFVVWNPGPKHGIGDLPEDGWKHFLCVESAQIESPIQLAGGETWSGSQTLRVFSEP